jgi:hypothetical protein
LDFYPTARVLEEPLLGQCVDAVGVVAPAKSDRARKALLCHILHLCIISVCIIGLLTEGAGAQNDAAARKRLLTEKLDSIDVEKQLRKRRGESLEDLEKAAEVLKDSVAVLKLLVPQGSQVSGAMTDSSPAGTVSGEKTPQWIQLFYKFLPKTFFDWMVDIVGFIAIVSGIVLIIGIFGLLSKGLKKKKKAPPLPKTLHEIFPRSYAADAYDRIPKVPAGSTEENNETIASLRKRIEDAPEKEPQDDGVLATVDDAADAKSAKEPLELKKQVIQAAQDGLDVSEISRRFHLSSDEVSLILRVARQSGTGPR